MAKSTNQQFKGALRQRLGMAPPPEEQIQEQLQSAWVQLEEAVVQVKEASDVLAEAAKGDPIVERAVGDATLSLATGLDGAVSAIETVEDLLIQAGLVSDDQLLEPA